MEHNRTCAFIDTRPVCQSTRMYVDLGAYRYALSIAGDGPSVICLHGFSESGYTWDSVQLRGYRMVRIDYIGHGGSDAPRAREPYEIPRVLRDLHTVIYHVAGDMYYLMGYSMGARLALLYALRYETQIKGLVLESGSAGIRDDTERHNRRRADERLADDIELHDGTWFAAKWGDVPIFQSQKNLPPVWRQRIRDRRAHNKTYALANTLRGSGQGVMPYVGEQAKKLSVSGLYVSGALDVKYTTIGREVFGGAANFQHVCIDDAGHNVHIERPDAFRRTVQAFLDEQEKGYIHESI